jgi:DNA segregation ATPase FtsK/SpoIIIE-like protein
MTDDELKALEPLYADAAEFAKSEATMSISKMQKRFKIGYNRASRICERLSNEGILIFDKDSLTWLVSGAKHG